MLFGSKKPAIGPTVLVAGKKLNATSNTTESMEELIRHDLRRGDDREAVYTRHDRHGHIKKRKA
ncbi:MAG: hypothetical protein JO205_07045 [Pseudolabrys sp.]|nr:hypothetical protein [Pseudolabrys sp.]